MPGKEKSKSKLKSPKAKAATVTVAVDKAESKKATTPLKGNKAKGKKEEKEKEPVVVEEEEKLSEEEDGSEEEDEDEGVDEEGMKKLLKALGDDGLDDFGQMQLDALGSDEDEEEGEGDDGSASESDGEEENEEGEDEDEDTDVEEEKEEKEGSDGAEEVELEDAESVDDDAVPRQKIVTNNTVALERVRDTIKLDPSLPWTETLSVTYPNIIEVDVNDDLKRELAFYKQALDGAKAARELADKHKLPFTRPSDYFAEMVKSDAHMERIRQRLLDEGAAIKKSEDARRQRENKKFGKQVQLEKQRERERSKKAMEERLKGLKRKRKDMLDDGNGDDGFDVAVEDAISDHPSKRAKNGSKISRKGRDAKFGFGGKGRRSKQNTRESTEKFEFGGSKKGAGGAKGAKSQKPKRLGKSRRMASKNR